MLWERSVPLVLSTAFGAPMPGRHGSSRAEGALSSVAVRSGARIFECPGIQEIEDRYKIIVMPPGRMVGAGARTLAVQD